MVSKDALEGYAGHVIPDEAHIARMLALLVNNPDGFVWIAEEEGVFIGMIGALKHAHVVSGEIGVGELFLWVHPDHRDGRGPGIALIRAMIHWAKSSGGKWLTMTAPAGNESLEKLYVAMGLVPIETQYQRRFE